MARLSQSLDWTDRTGSSIFQCTRSVEVADIDGGVAAEIEQMKGGVDPYETVILDYLARFDEVFLLEIKMFESMYVVEDEKGQHENERRGF
jgi:hypothetical protein